MISGDGLGVRKELGMKTIALAGLLLVALRGSTPSPQRISPARDVVRPKTAGELLQDCRAVGGSSASGQGVCAAFVDATWQSTNLMNHWKKLCAANDPDSPRGIVCLPGDATLDQVVRVVVEHLEKHPERHAQLAYGEALNAIYAAWPCAKPK
jgi:hypothetical protein